MKEETTMQTAYEIRESIRHCREGGSCGLCAYGAMEREAMNPTEEQRKAVKRDG